MPRQYLYLKILLAILVFFLFFFLGTRLEGAFEDTAEGTGVRQIPETKYKKAVTSYFWVGEAADEENGFIANAQSAWDENWLANYGGADDPTRRCGSLPCGFIPKENSFYFALPYNDKNLPTLKNSWIEIVYKNKTCYAQWEDVGPFESDDFEYVFGINEIPKNTFGLKAGLDVSPAVRDCLRISGDDVTLWRFVPEAEVPSGPWKKIITR